MDAKRMLVKARQDIARETDISRKMLKVASMYATLIRDVGGEMAVVGDSAIELITEGEFSCGHLEMRAIPPFPLKWRECKELIQEIGAEGGSRRWQVAGLSIHLLGPLDAHGYKPFFMMRGPYGIVLILNTENILVEQVQISLRPKAGPDGLCGAKMLVAGALAGVIRMDWNEVERLARLPNYDVLSHCQQLVGQVARMMNLDNPIEFPGLSE